MEQIGPKWDELTFCVGWNGRGETTYDRKVWVLWMKGRNNLVWADFHKTLKSITKNVSVTKFTLFFISGSLKHDELTSLC